MNVKLILGKLIEQAVGHVQTSTHRILRKKNKKTEKIIRQHDLVLSTIGGTLNPCASLANAKG